LFLKGKVIRELMIIDILARRLAPRITEERIDEPNPLTSPSLRDAFIPVASHGIFCDGFDKKYEEYRNRQKLLVRALLAVFLGNLLFLGNANAGTLLKEANAKTPKREPAINEPAKAVEYVPGKIGSCLRFNGGSSCVEIASPQGLSKAQFTISTWIYPEIREEMMHLRKAHDGFAGGIPVNWFNEILSIWPWWSGVDNGGWSLSFQPAKKKLLFRIYEQDRLKLIACEIEPQSWSHIVITYNGKEISLYVDGKLKGSIPYTGKIPDSGPLRISNTRSGCTTTRVPFVGCIDELKIYNSALSINTEGDPIDKGVKPVLYFPFEKRRDDAVMNASGSNNHGQIKRPQRPYQMVRSGRKQKRPALVDFEDLSSWEVVLHGDADCTLQRSQIEKMWGDYVAEIIFSTKDKQGYIELKPQNPIPIPGEFDCVSLWVFGDHWKFWERTVASTISVRIKDAQGEMHEVEVGDSRTAYWSLRRRKILPERWKENWPISHSYEKVYQIRGGKATYSSWGGDGDKIIDWPAEFVSLILRPHPDGRKRIIYMDSLSFYKEELKPVAVEKQIEPLPFPTTPDTILPTCKASYKNRVYQKGKKYIFEYKGSDSTLQYLYSPRDGSLSDINVVYNNGTPFLPCDEGGLEMEIDGALIPVKQARIKVKLLDQNLADNRLTTRWRWNVQGEELIFTLSLTIKGKSLIIDYQAEGGKVARLSLGKAQGMPSPKLISVPYLKIQSGGPRVVYSNGIFLLGLIDWYNSEATAFFCPKPDIQGDSVVYNGGAIYGRKTNGKRNDLSERIFLTVSADFHEVLPNIPNPASPHREKAGKYFFTMRGSHPKQNRPLIELLKGLKIEDLMIMNHEVFWADRGKEELSRTYKPLPRIGKEGLKEYSQWVQSLGYLFGFYTCFTGYASSSEVWDEENIAANPDGDWRQTSHADNLVRPVMMPQWEKRTAQRLHREYNTDLVYLDLHTKSPPWRNIDFDARYPGAGKFRTTFDAFGRVLLSEQKIHGMVFSEGTSHWLYSGLATGNFATLLRGWEQPLLPDFDLLKIHPLEVDLGMAHGAGLFFLGNREFAKVVEGHPHDIYFSQYLAATITYGHAGLFWGSITTNWGLSGQLKYYYMLHQLQQRYAADEVETIRYHDGTKFIDTSTALANDINKRGRFYVKYRKGLEIFVNYNAEENWKVEVNAKQYILPPYGFVAYKPGDILEISCLIDGKRVEYVDSPAYLYADTWGNKEILLPKIRLKGTAVVKKVVDDNYCWVIIPNVEHIAGGSFKRSVVRDCPMVSLKLDAFFPEATAQNLKVWACSEDGVEQAEFPCEIVNGWLTIRPKSNEIFKYKIAPVKQSE